MGPVNCKATNDYRRYPSKELKLSLHPETNQIAQRLDYFRSCLKDTCVLLWLICRTRNVYESIRLDPQSSLDPT